MDKKTILFDAWNTLDRGKDVNKEEGNNLIAPKGFLKKLF